MQLGGSFNSEGLSRPSDLTMLPQRPDGPGFWVGVNAIPESLRHVLIFLTARTIVGATFFTVPSDVIVQLASCPFSLDAALAVPHF